MDRLTLLENAFSHLPVALFCKDAENDFSFNLWNSTAEKMLGLSASEVLGKNDYDFFPKDQADFFRKKDQETLSLGQTITIDREPIESKGKRRWLRTLKVPLMGSGGTYRYLLGISEDITERVEAEEKITREKAMAAMQSRLNSLNEIASALSHELNNPLTIILGKAQHLRQLQQHNQLQKEDLLNAVEKIESTISRINTTLRALRAFGNSKEQDPLETFFITELIEDLQTLIGQRYQDSKIEFKIVPPPSNLKMRGRPVQLLQAILNLLGNAQDAVSSQTIKWIQLEFKLVGQIIEISVSDSGAPIAPEVREKMMLPFFTTKPFGTGAGLGLSFTRRVCEAQGGTLILDSKLQPTRLIMSLPLDGVEQPH